MRTLRGAEQVERAFGVPVLGQIPHLNVRRGGPRSLERDSPQAAAFRLLRANVLELAAAGRRTLAVTSPATGQGKTVVLASLAAGLAEAGQAVVAVEADLHAPRLAESLAAPGDGPGLAGVLDGGATLEAALREFAVAGGARLAFLPGGAPAPPLDPLFAAPAAAELLAELGRRFGHVLLNVPPLSSPEGPPVAARTDGALLVVRRDRTTLDEARATAAQLARHGIELVGAVLTEAGDGDPAAGTVTPDELRRRLQRQRPGDVEAHELAPPPRTEASYTLAELERAAALADLDARRAADLGYYVAALRKHADAEGVLPAWAEPLVDEVFGDVLSEAS